jgi:hypothetical protein
MLDRLSNFFKHAEEQTQNEAAVLEPTEATAHAPQAR